MVACIIAGPRERDNQWFTLAMDQFDVSEHLLRHYLANGNSMLLANLNQILRKICHEIVQDDLQLISGSWILLQLLAQFDPKNTLPELQHDFCALWNEIVQRSRKNKNYFTPFVILQKICHIFIVLHPGVDTTLPVFAASADPLDPIFFKESSYPLCDITDHRHFYLGPRLLEMATQGTMLPSVSTSIPPIASHCDTIPTALSSSAGPNLPLSDPDFTSPHPAEQTLDVSHARKCFPSVSSHSESLGHDGLPTATTDVAAASTTKGIATISSPASPIHRSIPSGDVTPLPIPPHSAVHSVPSALPTHTLRSVAFAGGLLSSGSSAVRSDSISNESVPPPPASTIVALSSTQQKASVLDPDVSTRSADLRTLDDAQDLNLPSRVEHAHPPDTCHLSAPGVATGTLQTDENCDPSGNLTDSPYDQI